MPELKLKFFDEIAEEEVRWLWKPYIAFGKITVIQGDPGNGKTTLALAIAALISRREKMPTGDAPTFVGNIIYQSGEDNPQDTLKPRLAACGADCSKIACIEADGSLSPKLLEEAIVETNTKYVVLDPLQAFLTGKQDISSAKDMRPFLNELREVAARTGAAIVIVGHMNKGERSKSIYRGLGSIDITAQARSVLLVGKRKSDPGIRFMTQIKNNLSAFGKSVGFTMSDDGSVEFLGESDVQEEDLLSSTLKKQTKFQLASQIISTMLEDGDKRSNEIYDACLCAGVNSGTMQQVKRKLGVKSIHKPDDWYWTLNPDAEDAGDDELPADLHSDDSEDETPVDFVEDVGARLSMVRKAVLLKHPDPVIQSPFGELTLIDWRACS
jgi:energy-coupling factor transporter ATP-binding protein EcfA2